MKPGFVPSACGCSCGTLSKPQDENTPIYDALKEQYDTREVVQYWTGTLTELTEKNELAKFELPDGAWEVIRGSVLHVLARSLIRDVQSIVDHFGWENADKILVGATSAFQVLAITDVENTGD